MASMLLAQRYLMREVLAAIFLVLAAFLALFGFFDFIDELRDVGKSGYGVWHALLFVVLGIPGLIYELLPIAALIGTLYALSTLARHSEITVLRASGLSTAALLRILFRVAAILALIIFTLGEAVAPAAERFAQEMRARALSQVIAQAGFVSGLWVKDGRSFINIRSATADARLQGVRIYRFSGANALESVTEAKEAFYEHARGWALQDVVRTMIDVDGARVERVSQEWWRSAVTPDLLSVLMVAPERMSLYGLFGYTRHLADNGQKTERYRIALWKKLIYPLATFVMVALALPFGYSHDRVGGVSLKIFAGVMLGIVFYALNGLFSNLGVINAWPPFASAVAPSALFLLTAAILIWWVERR